MAVGKEVQNQSQGTENMNYSSSEDLTSTASNRVESTEEIADYDPFAEREIPHPTSDGGALAHMLKCSLGSGILAMPNAFNNAGLAFGAVGTVLVGLMCTHCFHILVKASRMACRKTQRPTLTYAETGEQAFATGPPALRKFAPFAKGFVNGGLVVSCYGTMIVYVVFIAESFKLVYNNYVPDSPLDIRIWMVMLLLPLCLLCLIRDLKYLVPFSWLANLFILVGFSVTLYYMIVNIRSPDGLPMVAEVETLPLFFSTVIFAMEGIAVIMPIENNMKNPHHFTGYKGILNISMFIVITIYAVIGLCGYITYGNCTKASVTFNLPEKKIMAQVVKVMIGLAILFTYPLQFYAGTEIILGFLQTRIPKQKFNMFQNIYRVIVVFLSVGVAAAVPNLGPVISLVGAIGLSSLGVFAPAVIETVVCYDGQLGKGKWILYKNIVIGSLAILALISGSYTSILEIIGNDNKETNCTDIRDESSSYKRNLSFNHREDWFISYSI